MRGGFNGWALGSLYNKMSFEKGAAYRDLQVRIMMKQSRIEEMREWMNPAGFVQLVIVTKANEEGDKQAAAVVESVCSVHAECHGGMGNRGGTRKIGSKKIHVFYGIEREVAS